jgi:hypothetical protein
MFAKISGTGSYLPKKVLYNNDIAKMVETSDEWITQRVGIRQRHIASEEESTVMMAVNAARNAMSMAKVNASDIDLIIVATGTADYIMPSTASIVQAQINAPWCPAFDISAACSGFVYAVDIAKQYTTRNITFYEKGQSFTVHSYDRHINNVQAAAVVSHIAANHLHNTNQIAESFCVFVSLPSAPVFSVQDSHGTSPASAPTPDQPQPQPVGADAPQPAVPNEPAVGQHLSPDHKAEVSKVLHAFKDVFAEPSGINPHLSPFHIRQKTGVPEKPFIRYARRLTLEERAAVQLTIEKFLAKGWIQPSDSEWGAPIMFIRKHDGSLRAVVDYRQLNAQSSSDGVKLPLLSECLQSMAGRQFYSKLDLADGYFQVPMDVHSVLWARATLGRKSPESCNLFIYLYIKLPLRRAMGASSIGSSCRWALKGPQTIFVGSCTLH